MIDEGDLSAGDPQQGDAQQGDPQQGRAKVQWARRSMPLSEAAMDALSSAQPCHIAIALPLDPSMANFALGLMERGFAVSVLADNTAPADLQAALQEAGAAVCTMSHPQSGREALLQQCPDIVLDQDGALLAALGNGAKGGTIAGLAVHPDCEEIDCPVIHLGASELIRLITANGCGQATVSGFLDITNLQIAGGKVLVIGYGPIAQGAARYARGYGAKVIVAEADPVKALKATLDGCEVADPHDISAKPMLVINALEHGAALTMAQLERLPSGVFLCSATANLDAFPLSELRSAPRVMAMRDHVKEHTLASGHKVRLVCEGLPISTALERWLPLEYADVLFAAQLCSIAAIVDPDSKGQPGVTRLAHAIEEDLAAQFVKRR